MSRRTRSVLFLASAALLAAVLGFALAGLPGYDAALGNYASFVARHAVAQRGATNTVMTVTFDYRALDTLGEEFMIFTAAVGTAVLLRVGRDEHEDRRTAGLEERRAPDTSDVLRKLGGAFVPLTVVLGAYVVAHGHLTPGGGFQGGVVLAAALLFTYVGGRALALRHVDPIGVAELVEAAGAAGFVLIGVGGLVFGVAFLQNFLGHGKPGDLLSGGTVPLGNLAVGIEVAGAFALVLVEFLDQVVLVRRGRGQ
jgi:multicomponent Na+:H+ antiporter subunit B